jgi:hypothetical protein
MIISFCRMFGVVMWYYNDKMKLVFWTNETGELDSSCDSLTDVRETEGSDIIYDDGAE